MTDPNDGRRDAVRTLERAASTHAGLWLDKYLAALRPAAEEKTDKAGDALRTLLAEAARTPVPDGYGAAYARRRALIEHADGGVEGGVTRLFVAATNGRMVLGLGAQAIRKTNIALLHTWGVPFIPGSALKGLASAAAHGLAAEDDTVWKKLPEQGEDHGVLFGDTKSAGCVVFHDAWWIPGPGDTTLPLDLDVMTVHHPLYYRDGTSAPADWDEPTPVAFLTAHGQYLVALTGPEAWVGRAASWLGLGLQHLGIGAKTQAGYGRMTWTAERTARELRESEERDKHKARLAVLRSLEVRHKGAGTARQHVQQFREALTAGAPAAEVYEIARAMFAGDAKFWKAWAGEARRTAEERAFMQASEWAGVRAR